MALAERHDLIDDDHRLYDLAHAAAMDAPTVDADGFRTRFRDLARDPAPSGYRRHLVQATRSYVDGDGPAAD